VSTKTCISSPTPYASPADYLARVDVRLTGDLARDDGTEASPAELLTDPNLAAALADASGIVEACVLTSQRYSVADLGVLTGNSLAFLKRIICGLAVQCMRWRRGYMEESSYPLYKEAARWLDELHDGREIFAFAETARAGLPDWQAVTPSDLWRYRPTSVTSNPNWGIRPNRRAFPAGFGCSGGWDR